jgi:hypothetical protein
MSIFSRTLSKQAKTSTNVVSKSSINMSSSSEAFLLGKDETLNPKFTKIFDINYSVNIYYLKINAPELNLEKNCININLPMNYKNYNNQKLLNTILEKMYIKIAENEIENIMEKARHIFGYAPENYEIKKLSGVLATCNKNEQTIIISPTIVMYSKEIIEYIIFHEFCHLKYKTHSQKFYQTLEKYIPNYKNFDKHLCNLKY